MIARLHTYRKVSKLLVRLAIEGRIPPTPRAPLLAGGETVGLLTSAAAIPGEDRVAGLGYVRGEDAVEGRQMEVARGDHAPARAVVLGAAR